VYVKMAKPTKRIRIPYSGSIYAKQGVYGPITTPYREDIDVIQAILVAGIPVIEVIDGREIKLTIVNYKEDFSDKKEEESDPVPLDPNVVVPVPSDITPITPVVTKVNETTVIENDENASTVAEEDSNPVSDKTDGEISDNEEIVETPVETSTTETNSNDEKNQTSKNRDKNKEKRNTNAPDTGDRK
jgi:hypothetical protein